MGAIQWTDLGRKYIIKRGKRSMLADINESVEYSRQHKTDYDLGNLKQLENQKLRKIELGGEDKTMTKQLSLSRMSQLNLKNVRNQSNLNLNTIHVNAEKKDINDIGNEDIIYQSQTRMPSMREVHQPYSARSIRY